MTNDNQTALDEEFVRGEELDPILTRFGELHRTEANIDFKDSKRIVKFDFTLESHDGFAFFVNVNNLDACREFAPTIADGDVNRHSVDYCRESVCVYCGKRTQQGSFPGSWVSVNGITHDHRKMIRCQLLWHLVSLISKTTNITPQSQNTTGNDEIAAT